MSDYFVSFYSMECLVTLQNTSLQPVEHVDAEVICKIEEKGVSYVCRLPFYDMLILCLRVRGFWF